MAEEYEIDKLSLDIEVDTSKAKPQQIDELSQALDKLSNVLGHLETSKKQLSSFTTRLNNFNKKLSNIDITPAKKTFQVLADAVEPFIKKISSAQSSLEALNGILNGSNKLTKVAQPNNKKEFSFLSLGKWSAIIYAARKLGRSVAEIAQKGADYSETLNLWETAMGNNLNVATSFVDKMNEAYGVSEKTLMNAQAIFKNMLGSLGQISDQTAYRLSEGVTQMALDYASLYNVTFEQAFTKFQAALAGQVRPIRSVSGYDITENTIFQLYQSLGGTKTMRQLSRTEKQLLSILSIFNQMEASHAIGDLEKTMGSFANQSRVFAESWQRIVSYSGVLLTYSIQQSGLMTYINGVLLFIGEVLKGIVEAEGALTHYENPFEDVTQGAYDAIKATDELKGKLLGFDKFNALNQRDQENVNIEESLLSAISNFNTIFENADGTSSEIVKKLKEASGLFDDKGFFDTNAWEEIKTQASLLLPILETIGGILLFKGIHKPLEKLGTSFKDLGKTIKDVVMDPKKLGILAIIAAITYMYQTNEDFRDSVNNLLSVLLQVLSTVLEPTSEILALIAPVLADVLTLVAEIVTPVIDIIANVISLLDQAGILKGVLLAVGAFLLIANATGSLNVVIIGAIIGALILLGSVIKNIIDNFDVLWQSIKDIGRGIGNFFANIFIGIGNFVISVVNFIIDAINSIISPIDAIAGIFGGQAKIPKIQLHFEYDPIPQFADGGLPNKGSLFIAGESGAELITDMGGGQSGVMNMEQLENAVTRGIVIGLSAIDTQDDRPINIYIDGQRFFSASRAIYQKNGYDVSKVKAR